MLQSIAISSYYAAALFDAAPARAILAIGCGIRVTRHDVETDAPILTVPAGVMLAPLG